MGKFKFNGISSEDFGLVIQTPPPYVYPERDLTNNHIPGRSGDIIVDNKCFKNTERTYQIAKGFNRGTTYYENFQSILDWLNSANGSYARLEDSYDSDVYRLASFQIGGAITNYFDEAGATEIKFNCKPQRYLVVGEEETKYYGATLSIENPSRCLALPEITVKNINTGEYGVLMMSVLDKSGNATSSISFTEYSGDITLNSEDQTVCDPNGEGLYDILSLNGKSFPSFGESVSSIQFAKYDIESSGPMSSYSSLILASQESCLAEYKTYSAIESSKQEKFLIKSYNYIIDSYKKSYLASSLQTMIASKASVYKFESFNTLLTRYASVFQFTGSLEDNASECPGDWLEFDIVNNKIKAKITGFFMVGPSGKRIMFIKAGEDVIGDVDSNTINSIYYYKAKIDDTVPENTLNAPTVVVEGATKYYSIEVKYTDAPTWAKFVVEYSIESGSPTKISYVRAANGYYWTDKTWIFGKAQWAYYSGTNYETFASLSWSTSKKAFVSNEGLSLSTTMTFTYKYLGKNIVDGIEVDVTPTTLPEYSPVMEEKVNDDTGEKKSVPLYEVHFTVKDSSTKSDITSTAIYAKDNGFYSIKSENISEPTAWTWFNIGGLITTIGSGTDGFEVFYLASIPDYSEQIDWPDWLDPIPEKTGENPLVPTSLKFKVKKSAFYRTSSSSSDESGGSSAWGTIKQVGDFIIPNPVKTSEDYYYIYMVDEIPVVYPSNRCYTYKSNGQMTTTETPPLWLHVEEVGVIETNSTTPMTIKYKVGAAGYYKWDSNSAWIKKEVADIDSKLFESSGKDDSTIYYLSTLPSSTIPVIPGLFEVTIKTVSSTGAPSEIEYKVAETGYYRFNNHSNWEYVLSGAVLFSSKINETNTLYHLKKLNDTLAELEIVIKPRWWML